MAAGRNLEGAAGSIAPSCATPGMEAQGAAARDAAAQGAAACATQSTRAPEYAHATCNLTTALGAPGIATATPAIAAGMRTTAARGSAGLAPGGATQGTAELGMESHGTAVPSTPGVSHGHANPGLSAAGEVEVEAAAEEAAAAVATVAAHRMPPARRPMPLQQNPPCDSRSASRFPFVGVKLGANCRHRRKPQLAVAHIRSVLRRILAILTSVISFTYGNVKTASRQILCVCSELSPF